MLNKITCGIDLLMEDLVGSGAEGGRWTEGDFVLSGPGFEGF